ncbi:PulJ/GspJ family protein [Aliidiomarina sp. Khilg15.8]
MKICRWKGAGFTLLEVVIASALMGVGTLAVFTLYLHLQAQPAELAGRYERLQKAQQDRPEPLFVERWSALSCEVPATRESWREF